MNFPEINVPGNGQLYARFVTSQGDILIKLEEQRAPNTVKNFVGLATGNLEWKDPQTGKSARRPFYDGLIFHRVIPNFMIQGGGFTQELVEKPAGESVKNESRNHLHNERGSIAMARTDDPDSAGAQFFINVRANLTLDFNYVTRKPGYTVFGRVIDGMDVVDGISLVNTQSAGHLDDVPVNPIVIESITRLE